MKRKAIGKLLLSTDRMKLRDEYHDAIFNNFKALSWQTPQIINNIKNKNREISEALLKTFILADIFPSFL